MAKLVLLLFAVITLLCSSVRAQAPAPGSTIPLLFLNTTAQPLTAYVERAYSGGSTTYLVTCDYSQSSACSVNDATLTVLPGETYDYHESVNSGGALTIHCTLDGETPTSCTRTVAGGPDGYTITTSVPGKDTWTYLPVRITKTPAKNAAYTGASAASVPVATATSSAGLQASGTTTLSAGAALAATSAPASSSTLTSAVGRLRFSWLTFGALSMGAWVFL